MIFFRKVRELIIMPVFRDSSVRDLFVTSVQVVSIFRDSLVRGRRGEQKLFYFWFQIGFESCDSVSYTHLTLPTIYSV